MYHYDPMTASTRIYFELPAAGLAQQQQVLGLVPVPGRALGLSTKKEGNNMGQLYLLVLVIPISWQVKYKPPYTSKLFYP